MPAMWWVVSVVVAVLLLATYLTWTSSRVDRLHARAGTALAALDAQLVRRAAAVGRVADSLDDGLRSHVDPLRAASRHVLEAVPDEREAAENDLTWLLRKLPLQRADPALAEVVAASRRVALSRQVHSDLVRDALKVRRHPVVRVLRLAGRHPRPQYFDIDDTLLDGSDGVGPQAGRGAPGVT